MSFLKCIVQRQIYLQEARHQRQRKVQEDSRDRKSCLVFLVLIQFSRAIQDPVEEEEEEEEEEYYEDEFEEESNLNVSTSPQPVIEHFLSETHACF